MQSQSLTLNQGPKQYHDIKPFTASFDTSTGLIY